RTTLRAVAVNLHLFFNRPKEHRDCNSRLTPNNKLVRNKTTLKSAFNTARRPSPRIANKRNRLSFFVRLFIRQLNKTTQYRVTLKQRHCLCRTQRKLPTNTPTDQSIHTQHTTQLSNTNTK